MNIQLIGMAQAGVRSRQAVCFENQASNPGLILAEENNCARSVPSLVAVRNLYPAYGVRRRTVYLVPGKNKSDSKRVLYNIQDWGK